MDRKIVAALGIAFAALAIWVGVGPFITAGEIHSAVARNDEASLDQHIDFPAVRDSLKNQLFGLVDDRGAPDQSGGGFGDAIKNLMGGAVDVMLTPHGVLLLLQHKTALGNPSSGGPQDSPPATSSAPSPSRRKPVIHYRFASLDRFVVTVADDQYPDIP